MVKFTDIITQQGVTVTLKKPSAEQVMSIFDAIYGSATTGTKYVDKKIDCCFYVIQGTESWFPLIEPTGLAAGDAVAFTKDKYEEAGGTTFFAPVKEDKIVSGTKTYRITAVLMQKDEDGVYFNEVQCKLEA